MVAKSRCLASLLPLVTHFGATVAQTPSASFSYPEPSSNLPINIIDTIVVQWQSNFQNAWLWLWCGPDQGIPKHCTRRLNAKAHTIANKPPKISLHQ
jgi:hypothetical protein